jgi:hypothetical protein
MLFGVKVRSTIEIALASTPTFTFFYGPFYGRAKSCRKTVQFYITPCKRHSLGLPMIRNAVQHSENVRNSLGLNYKAARESGNWKLLGAVFWSRSATANVTLPVSPFTRRENPSGGGKMHDKKDRIFTVVFYGLRNFCCKTAQFCDTPCES